MEKMTVSSGIDPQEPMGALIVLDHAMGDEWMNVDPDWAMDQVDVAIQTLEQYGMLSSLPGRYGRFVHKWIEEN